MQKSSLCCIIIFRLICRLKRSFIIYKITVTTASGIETVTKREIEKLGYGVNPAINGAITFDGDALAVARANMFLKTADRVYITLGEFTAITFDELFDGVLSIPFEEFMPKTACVLVDGKCVKSQLFAVTASQKIVKKAVMTRLSKAYKTTDLPESGEVFKIEFSIFKDTVAILLNTSGQGLHKRGYRDYVAMAPMRENMASAMLMLSDFGYNEEFVDPFCGSGTIVIEGAKMALGIAPGILRDFDYTNWSKFDSSVYKLAYEEAKDKERLDKKINFHGSDIDPKAIKLAQRHAFRAGLSDKISFEVKDVKDFTSKNANGTIVTNPPYGDRLLSKSEVSSLYKTLGKIYRGLDNWSLFLITSADGFEKDFGMRADKNRKLYNSGKECRFYEFFRKNCIKR